MERHGRCIRRRRRHQGRRRDSGLRVGSGATREGRCRGHRTGTTPEVGRWAGAGGPSGRRFVASGPRTLGHRSVVASCHGEPSPSARHDMDGGATRLLTCDQPSMHAPGVGAPRRDAAAARGQHRAVVHGGMVRHNGGVARGRPRTPEWEVSALPEPTTPADFYVAGGTLRADAPSYVPRRADDQLYAALQRG